MTSLKITSILLFSSSLLHLCCALPLSSEHTDFPDPFSSVSNHALFLISGATLILLIYAAVGCVCCPNKSIKALSYQNGFPVSHLNENNSLQFENPSEFAIFPPHSTVIDLQPVGLSYPGFEEKVTFEPLPDILPRKMAGPNHACSSRPAHFRALLKNKISFHDWFDDPSSNFPRDQLQYINEIGNGWFGRVVEGEASRITTEEDKTKVTVKILREEASPSEHLHFLYEARAYRDLLHPNVVRLLGRCLESDPFLLIMEHSMSDLKSYLLQQDKKDALVKNGILLRMAYNIAAGLRHLHKSGFSHADLAAHNCFVCSDLTIKVGDYGISYDRHRGDYYCLGDIALPIRWYSPETLLCTDTTIETKEVTKEANVWAFGIVLWEIFQFGMLPYEELTHEEVLQRVLIERTWQLRTITLDYPLKEEVSFIMRECWKSAASRPSMDKVENFLTQLYNDRHNLKMLESFEERWNSLQPRSSDSKSSERGSFKFENDSSIRNEYHNYSSDGETFSSFETSYDLLNNKNLNSRLSPSLRVLNGSIDELTENDTFLNSVSLGGEKSSNDVVSVLSDTSLMDDDAESCASPEQSSALMDLILAAQPYGKSKQFQETSSQNSVERVSVEGNASKVVEPFSSSSYSMGINAENEFIYLDDNSNEMDPPSHQSNPFLTENDVRSTLHQQFNTKAEEELFQNNTDLKCEVKDINSNAEKFLLKSMITNFATVPNIVVDEVPMIVKGEVEKEDLFETENSDSNNGRAPKPFRFVFKPDHEDAVFSDAPLPVDCNFPSSKSSSSPELSKTRGRSHPLTSTPLKSEIDDDLNLTNCYSEETESVFYDSFLIGGAKDNFVPECGEPLHSSNIKTSCFEGEQARSGVSSVETVSSDIFYYEASSAKFPAAPLPDFVKSSASLTNEEDYESAQSGFDVTGCNNDTSNLDVSSVLSCLSKKSGEGTAAAGSDTMCTLLSFIGDARLSKCPSESRVIPNANDVDNGKMPATLTSHLKDVLTSETSINDWNCSEGDIIQSEKQEVRGQVNLSPHFEDSSTPEYTLNSSYSTNDYKYSSTDSTPFSFSESGSNIKAEVFQNGFDQYNGSRGEFLQQQMGNLRLEGSENRTNKQESKMQSNGNLRNRSNFNCSSHSKTDSFRDDLLDDSEGMDYKSKAQLCLFPYEEVVVEDLETGEQTVISENFSACDDYENSGESDEFLKIDIETDEAIIVDSSEGLLGFVPSRSIEMLQECEIMPDLSYSVDEGKESTDFINEGASNGVFSSPALNDINSPNESPDSSYALHQPFRNFCLQNEVIEEEITDEIASPSSIHSTASFSSNEIFAGGEERMSQSSESYHQMAGACETSVLPVMDHFYAESDDGSKTDISNSCSDDPNEITNIRYVTDVENNVLPLEEQDVMHSWQPTQSVRWNSDETLEVDEDMGNPIIIEGQEILAGSNGITIEDITTAFTQMNMEDRLNCKVLDRLSVSQTPSPYSSTESSPCRDGIYTPDFESDSDDTGSGSSCSSTSGSFECIHNKFKNMVDVSKVVDESDASLSSREQSPIKVFSNTWNCHATPTRSVLATPEKKFSSMRKSVSFHEEDPQMVFEYPPAIYSSEEEEEKFKKSDIDYKKYADWELQAGDNDEVDELEDVLKIEEFDSEPYVRRPTYSSRSSVGPLNRPMLYSLTSEFSDDDFDFTETSTNLSESNAPSNSPEEGKHSPLSGFQMNELICSQLNNLALEESRLKWMQDVLKDKSQEITFHRDPKHSFSVQESEKHHHENVSASAVQSLIDNALLDATEILSVQEEVIAENGTEQNEKEETTINVVNIENKNAVFLKLDETSDFSLISSDIFKDDHSSLGIVSEISKFNRADTNLSLSKSIDPVAKDLEDIINVVQEDLRKGGNSECVITASLTTEEPGIIVRSQKQTEVKSLDTNMSQSLKEVELMSSPKTELVQSEKDVSCNLILVDGEKATEEILFNESSLIINCSSFENALFSDFKSEHQLEDIDNFDAGNNIDKNIIIDIDSVPDCTSLPSGPKFVDLSCNKVPFDTDIKMPDSKVYEKYHNVLNEPIEPSEKVIESIKIVEDSKCRYKYSAQRENVITEMHSLSKGTECPNIVSFDDHIIDQDKMLSNDINNKARAIGKETVTSSENITFESSASQSCNAVTSANQRSKEQLVNISQSFDLASSQFVPCPLPHFSKDTEASESVSWKEGKESALNIKSVNPADISKGSEFLNTSPTPFRDLLPEIVITPASESDLEDELEEYLRHQLEFVHVPDAEGGFSVTSQYTARPFDEGLYQGVKNTGSYIEAFNFEFDSEDFFEDLLDEYALNENRDVESVNEDFPAGMIQKSPEFEQSQFESSPSYYASKDTTHL